MKKLAIILLAAMVAVGAWLWLTKPGEMSLPPLPEPPATAPAAPAPAAPVTGAATDAAPEAPAAEAPAEDDFDAAALIDRIAASDIDAAQKTSLTALVNAAANDAALRPSVLAQVEAALQ